MKLPRNIGGEELARLLSKFGYNIIRQSGSHIRLTSNYSGKEHHITIPRHSPLKIGTLGAIIGDIAENLKIEKQKLMEKLFK